MLELGEKEKSVIFLINEGMPSEILEGTFVVVNVYLTPKLVRAKLSEIFSQNSTATFDILVIFLKLFVFLILPCVVPIL